MNTLTYQCWPENHERKGLSKNILCEAKKFYIRHHTRKALKSLGAEQLQDLGINKKQALEEAQKPFWK